MSRQETLIISAIVRSGNMRAVKRVGIDSTLFTRYQEEMEWIEKQPTVPSKATFRAQFPDFPLRRVKPEEIPTLAEGLKENWLKHQTANLVQATAKKLSKRGKRPPSGEEIIRDLQEQVSVLMEKTSEGGVVEVISEGSKYLKGFRERQRKREQGILEGCSTGIPSIDRYTGGLLPSRLYFVIARQGNGKTYLMLLWAALALLDGRRVLWVSREMPDDMVAYRIHSIMSTVLRGADNAFSNLGLILGREDVSYEDYRDFIRKMRREVKGRLFIPENRSVHVRNLGFFIEKYNCDIAFYDYIGLVGITDGNRGWQELGAQATMAKEFAMQYKIPVVMAAQVNRAASRDGDEAPLVENIALSDQLGYTADQVIALQMGRNLDSQGRKMLEVWVRKQRYGQNDLNVQVTFDGDLGYLQEVDDSLQGVKFVDPVQKAKEEKGKRRRIKRRKRRSTESTEGKKRKTVRRKRTAA